MTTANAAVRRAPESPPQRPPAHRRAVFRSLREPKVAVMLMLGFSSGLPFFLTGNTLGYWLRDSGTALSAIGFISWVGLAYSLKFLWAPIIDRVDAPLAGRLGRRRGWMLVSQLCIALGLVLMSMLGLSAGLVTIGAFALLITDALILIMANHFGWTLSYGVMAALMIVGVAATFAAMEPRRVPATRPAGAVTAPLTTFRGLADAIVSPFSEFFRVHGTLALLMLAMISFYQLPEFVSGPMYNPYYHDLGLSKDVVGAVRASVGTVATIVG